MRTFGLSPPVTFLFWFSHVFPMIQGCSRGDFFLPEMFPLSLQGTIYFSASSLQEFPVCIFSSPSLQFPSRYLLENTRRNHAMSALLIAWATMCKAGMALGPSLLGMSFYLVSYIVNASFSLLFFHPSGDLSIFWANVSILRSVWAFFVVHHRNVKQNLARYNPAPNLSVETLAGLTLCFRSCSTSKGEGRLILSVLITVYIRKAGEETCIFSK